MSFLMLREHFPCVLLISFFLLDWFLQSVHATPFQVPSLCHLSESFPTILHWWTPLMCLFMLWGFFRILWQSLQLVHISYDGLACGPLDLNSWRSFHTTQLWWPTLLWPLKSFFFLSSFPHSSHSSLVDFVWHLSCDLAVHFFARLFPTIPASDRHFSFLPPPWGASTCLLMLNGVLKHFSHLLHAGTLPLVHISYDGSACGLLDLSSWSSFPTVYTIVVASTLVASQTFSLF